MATVRAETAPRSGRAALSGGRQFRSWLFVIVGAVLAFIGGFGVDPLVRGFLTTLGALIWATGVVMQLSLIPIFVSKLRGRHF